jgi:hypothetical protein
MDPLLHYQSYSLGKAAAAVLNTTTNSTATDLDATAAALDTPGIAGCN